MSIKLLDKSTLSPVANIPIVATTLTIIDATLVCDFSTQTATEVEVEATCSGQIVNAGTFYFGLIDAAGIVAGSLRVIASVATGTDLTTIKFSAWMTGLTPGKNYRWWLADKCSTIGEQLDIVGSAAHTDNAQIVFTVKASEAG